MNNFKDYEIFLENLKKEIQDFDFKLEAKEYGVIKQVGDGIAWVEGLNKVTIGEVVCFLNDSSGCGFGIVMGIEASFVNIMLLNKVDEVIEGVEIFSTNKHFFVPCGNNMIGRVVNSLGQVIDGKEDFEVEEEMPIEAPSPGIMDRSSVCEPLQTGIKIIDALIPIGLGQKQLILGDRQSGKSAIITDIILNQKKIKEAKDKFVYCIYVTIGKKASDIAKTYELLKKAGAMEYTTIVATTASEPAAMQYIAPMSGTAIAEFLCKQGKNVLVIFDDLTKHADAYREISLLMRRTPARGAYPGDIFYLHSRLLERAVKLKTGGSITMLPIIETQAGDVSDYIPTNVISITDGQIYLDKQLFFEDQKPAINIGLSVSRIGSSAQHSAMKKIAGRLKGELAQFRELEAFAKSVSDLDEQTKKIITRGQLLMKLFKQNIHEPRNFHTMILLLFGGSRGLFDNITIDEKIEDFEKRFITFIEQNNPEIITTLNKTHNFDDKFEELTTQAIKKFVEREKNV